MSVNKYLPHILIIPEDHADEQLANGFVLHKCVGNNVLVERPAGGWPAVLAKFENDLISYLRRYPTGFVVLLIDFDEQYDTRRTRFRDAVPDDLSDRVFVLGVRVTPEAMKQALGKSLEGIGLDLAQNCLEGVVGLWNSDHLAHNSPDLSELQQRVRDIIFPR